MSAMEGRVAPARLRIRRQSAEVMRIGDPILDYIVYWCPIRSCYAFAMMDAAGEYWTAPHWHMDGILFEHRHGTGGVGLRINKNHENPLLSGVLSEIASTAWNLKEALNDRPEPDSQIAGEYTAFVTPREYKTIEEYGQPGTQYLVIPMDVIRNRYEDPDPMAYDEARHQWEKAFETHYPRPQGSPESSHWITTRTARFKHRKKVVNSEREARKRESRLVTSAGEY